MRAALLGGVLVAALLFAPIARAQEAEPAAEPAAEPDVAIGTPLQVARVRLTWYAHGGITYSGERPYLGSCACSWNWDLGTRFVLPDGSVVRCNDRGLLGDGAPYGWLDVYGQPRVAAWGPYAVVEVLL